MNKLSPESLLALGMIAALGLTAAVTGLAVKAKEPASVYWLVDAAPLAVFHSMEECEADRQSLGITADEYFCEVRK